MADGCNDDFAGQLPWELFRDAFGEKIYPLGPNGEMQDSGDGRCPRYIVAVLYFYTHLNAFGQGYQSLEIEIGHEAFPENDLLDIRRDYRIALDRESYAGIRIGDYKVGQQIPATHQYRINREVKSTYPNSRRYVASNEAI